MRLGVRPLIIAACAAVFGFVRPAVADAIDGDWCRADGKRMSIRGPAIVTPAGQQANGNYTRHSFLCHPARRSRRRSHRDDPIAQRLPRSRAPTP